MRRAQVARLARRWRELIIASHRRYTTANGDALAGSVTYSLLLSVIPAGLVAGMLLGWADVRSTTVADAVVRASHRTLPDEVSTLIESSTRDLDRHLSWIAIGIVLWLTVRSVRALRTAFRAMCDQPAGSGNPVSDNARDVVLAALLYIVAGMGVAVVAAVPTEAAGDAAATVVLASIVLTAMRLLPWPDARRPGWTVSLIATLFSTATTAGLATAGGAYLDATMSGRGRVFGAVATLVAAALWVSVAVRVVLRALSLAAVVHDRSRPAPVDDRALWVVVPAFREAEGITATLAALAAQTDLDFGVVVCDNDSDDSTVEVARGFAVTAPFDLDVVIERDRGVGYAVDTAVRHAIGRGADLIARTDADSLPRPDWIAAIRDRFARGAEVVCGASVPRAGEDPTLVERLVLPTVQRMLAVYGRYRGPHRGAQFLAPYVLTHGHSFAFTADVYGRAGGAARQPLEAGSEDVDLVNRARMVTRRVERADEVVVETSLRRLRAWGIRRTLLWHWDRRYVPSDPDRVHVRDGGSNPHLSERAGRG